jgi:ribosomal subunit interface protein
MKIIIQAPDLKLSSTLTDHINKKVESLSRYYDRIVESHVHLKKITTDEPENKVCEIKLAIPGKDLFAAKNAVTFREAVNKTVDTIRRQIADRKPDNQVSTPL